MIVCTNCQHNNPDGAIFCSVCGAQLTGSDLTTQNIRTDQVREILRDDAKGARPPMEASPTVNAWASLHLMESGQILPLTDRNEFTLGRVSEGQPIMPDLDLTPYQAYANGVSRLHAVVKRDSKRIVIMDLGSSNGTYVNGKRLTANVERLLSHGDVIALGKLKIQILIKSP